MNASITPIPEALLGRQPIVDRDLKTVGYELLYRQRTRDGADFEDGSQATTTVLSHLLVEFGIDEVVGSKQAWINFPERYMLNALPIPVDPSRLVLEVQEVASPDIADALRKLKNTGYKIAISDVDLKVDHARVGATIDYVKVDARHIGESVPEALLELQRQGVGLVAEKVESIEAFARLKGLGFQRFQGYFMAQPEILTKKRPSASRLALVRMLTEVLSPTASLQRIEELITQDAVLSYRLLRCLNSGLYALPRRIESIQHAIVLLGLGGIRNLVTVLAMARVDDRPEEIMIIGLTRARCSERLAGDLPGAQPEALFTVGLFSVMDAILGEPMSRVLERVPLSEDLAQGILDGEGPYGQALRLIEAQELGEWEEIEAMGFDPMRVSDVWLQSVRWAESLKQLLANTTP